MSRGNGRGVGRGGRGGGQGGGQGHPGHLRGKAIGLYYRDKYKEKNREKKIRKETMPIKLKISTEQKIRSLIDTPRSSYDKSFNAKEQYLDGNDFEARYNHINDSQFKKKFLNIISGNLQNNLEKALMTQPKLQKNEDLDMKLLNELKRTKESIQYKNMLRFRSKLPAYERRKEILNLINQQQVVLISGETGTFLHLLFTK